MSLQQSILTLNTNRGMARLPNQADFERANALENLIDFCEYAKPGYQTSHHHILAAEKLTAVFNGEIDRLIIVMPPRHGKSLMASQLFPCWTLGKRPHTEFVQSGYSADISLEQSRLARNVFVSEQVRALFPNAFYRPQRASQDKIPAERQAAQEWGTIQGGRYYAVGVQGGLTGRGADIALIDDPVKNREEAESELVRSQIWDWYVSTLYTRLSPQGAVILIMTRWHPQDLAGQLIQHMVEGEGDVWDVLHLKAIDDQGRALWPERWPLEKLEKIHKTLGEREFQALYQGEPVLRGGNLFDMEGVVVHDTHRDFPDIKYVRAWDLASTERERVSCDPDFTVGSLVGMSKEADGPHLWIKHQAYFQHAAPLRNERIISIAEGDGPRVPIVVESVAGYKDTFETLKEILKGHRVVHKISASSDKVVRNSILEPFFEAKRVHIVKGPWNNLFFNQFSQFPAGAHDDGVDSVGLGLIWLRKRTQNMSLLNLDRALLRA